MSVEGFPVPPMITMARILRPYNGFEVQYSGQSGLRPISFYETTNDPNNVDGVLVHDELVGQPGYQSTLERFVPTPFGSRMSAWIPYVFYSDGEEFTVVPYVYTFNWRLRNVPDTGVGRKKGYHTQRLAGHRVGGADQYAIPVAVNSVIVEQTESAGQLNQYQNLRRERIVVQGTPSDVPYRSILPDGNLGTLQQGIVNYDVLSEAAALTSSYLRVDFDAAGDELLIQANRADAFGGLTGNWTFDEEDAGFSFIYGVNAGGTAQVVPAGVGIYLFTGEAP